MARRLKTTIFIACEGKNTEPNYFERIAEEVEDGNFLAITVYPDQNEKADHKTDGIGLVKEAQSRAEEFDELYVVLDKDGYTQHAEVLQQAAQLVHGKRVTVCLSAIAFEQWVLLHFERNGTAFPKSADVINYLDATAYYPGYAKSAESDVYTTIKNKTFTAIEHAAWLRSFQQRMVGILAAHDYGAYTDVDVLVKRLFGHTTTIYWYALGDEFSIENLHCKIQSVPAGIEWSVRNEQNRTFVFNQANLGNYIIAYNEKGIDIHLTVPETIIITPGETKELALQLPPVTLDRCRLELNFNNTRAIIPLWNAF